VRLTLVTGTPDSVALGSGTHVAHETLRRELERLGHEVRVIRPRMPPESVLGLRRWRFNLALSPRNVAPADVVIGFDMDGFRLAGRLPCPFVNYIHGIIADEARFERGAVRLALGAQAMVERRAARRADLVLATSHYSRRRLTELYGLPEDDIAIAPPGLDLGRWRAALAAAGRAPVHGHPPTILCVAHMYPRKNLAALIRAAGRLAATTGGVRIRLVGDGPERANLEQLAGALGLGGTVEFAGHVSFDELAREYARAQVFCLPSLQEGFGLAFVEAMAAGLPVVACHASSTPELFGDQGGMLVPPGDDQALSTALKRLLDDPQVRDRAGRANRERAAGYDARITTGHFLRAIEPLVVGRTRNGGG
jgi:glycosyltransferase involved in cell wall biosynthesis